MRIEKLERVVIRPLQGKSEFLTNRKIVETLKCQDNTDTIIERNEIGDNE